MADEVNGGTIIYFSRMPDGFGEPVRFGRLGRDRTADRPYGFALEDLDHDGDLDLVVGHISTDLAVLTNDGKGSLSESGRLERMPFAGSLAPDGKGGSYGVTIADLNGDGAPDIVSAGLPTALYLQRSGK